MGIPLGFTTVTVNPSRHGSSCRVIAEKSKILTTEAMSYLIKAVRAVNLRYYHSRRYDVTLCNCCILRPLFRHLISVAFTTVSLACQTPSKKWYSSAVITRNYSSSLDPPTVYTRYSLWPVNLLRTLQDIVRARFHHDLCYKYTHSDRNVLNVCRLKRC